MAYWSFVGSGVPLRSLARLLDEVRVALVVVLCQCVEVKILRWQQLRRLERPHGLHGGEEDHGVINVSYGTVPSAACWTSLPVPSSDTIHVSTTVSLNPTSEGPSFGSCNG